MTIKRVHFRKKKELHREWKYNENTVLLIHVQRTIKELNEITIYTI